MIQLLVTSSRQIRNVSIVLFIFFCELMHILLYIVYFCFFLFYFVRLITPKNTYTHWFESATKGLYQLSILELTVKLYPNDDMVTFCHLIGSLGSHPSWKSNRSGGCQYDLKNCHVIAIDAAKTLITGRLIRSSANKIKDWKANQRVAGTKHWHW
jgi:hypothetical protein